jgi:hypothetical protein
MDYTGETCEYFAVSKKGCKLDGERASSTQVDSFDKNIIFPMSSFEVACHPLKEIAKDYR